MGTMAMAMKPNTAKTARQECARPLWMPMRRFVRDRRPSWLPHNGRAKPRPAGREDVVAHEANQNQSKRVPITEAALPDPPPRPAQKITNDHQAQPTSKAYACLASEAEVRRKSKWETST